MRNNYMDMFSECVNMWEYELFRDNQKSEILINKTLTFMSGASVQNFPHTHQCGFSSSSYGRYCKKGVFLLLPLKLLSLKHQDIVNVM